MTLLERLQSHRGGLIHLKTQLFWHDGRGWDGNPGRICLLLDVCPAAAAPVWRVLYAATSAAPVAAPVAAASTALLLIDGSPQWVWVAEADVEVLDEG